MFVSSLGSITGADNRLGLPRAKRVIVVLVDGLGAQNLKAAAGHAPFLNAALAFTKPIACGFPSTTATSITSFGTGVAAGFHGIVGYKVFDRLAGESVNMLNGWNAKQTPEVWQREQTVTQKALAGGVGAFVIGPPAYNDSGFTRATMRDAKYVPARSIAERVAAAQQLLRTEKSEFICYLYVPELDQIAHSAGVTSSNWLHELENLNSELQSLANSLGVGDALIITADHGVVDVPESGHIYLDEAQLDWSLVADVSGDPRVNFVYLKDSDYQGAASSVLSEMLGDRGLVLGRDQIVEAGWYGQVQPDVLNRLPDLFVLATKNVAIYQRDFAPAASLKMVGQHGALSSAEMMIPLLRFGR